MDTKRFFKYISMVLVTVALSGFTIPLSQAKTLYIGGTMALTGAYAEDTAVILAAYEDYTNYVNETKMMAPWRKEKFPEDITLEVLWRDDGLNPSKALAIYEELKAKGILLFRCSSTPAALALKDKLNADRMGATSMSTGPYLMSPPQTIYTYYPIYTDEAGATAEWFIANWKEKRKPRFAFLTTDSSFGRSVEIPELREFLKGLGFEIVGSRYVPVVPTSPPTEQLMWLKKNNVDLTFGCMINHASQPIVKEAVKLGMGPHLETKITFAAATPGHLSVMQAALGKLADGFVVAGGFPPMDDISIPGIKFCNDVQEYRGKKNTHLMYIGGMLEAMAQVEALRLAMEKVPVDRLTPKDVLEQGFHRITNLDTGGLSAVPLTYGPYRIEGVDQVRIDQIVEGKVKKMGVYPIRHIYKK